MIDSKHLSLLLAVAEQGSLTKAAKVLHLSSSALSHQLKNLEDQLDVKVFHRTEGKLYFTKAGKLILENAQQTKAEYELLSDRLRELKASQQARYIHGYSQEEKLLSAAEVEAGIKGLLNTTKTGGSFSYTFFKASGRMRS